LQMNPALVSAMTRVGFKASRLALRTTALGRLVRLILTDEMA